MQCLSVKSSCPPTSPQTQTQTKTLDLNSCPPHSQGKLSSNQDPHAFCLRGTCLRKCLNQACSLLVPGDSTDGTPRSSTAPVSPVFNLNREYALALQTNSYNEMRSRIEVQVQVENVVENGDTSQLILSQVLQPNRDCVTQALSHSNPKATLTRLVSSYFDHSENITNLCLSLYQCLARARTLYSPITELLQVFPYDLNSISQSQCDRAFDVFVQYDSLENPFPDSNKFNDMRRGFSGLQEQLDHCLRQSRSRVSLMRRASTGSAICLVGTVVGTVTSAVVISTHALAAIVGLMANPLCPVYVPSDLKKKQLAHMAQLDAAAKGTFIHNKDLDTIDRLVAWLYTAVEGDRHLIQIGLDRDRDIYAIHEVVKYLRNSHDNFLEQLKELEDHIYLCFNAVNKFRAKLLDQIHLYQSSDS